MVLAMPTSLNAPLEVAASYSLIGVIPGPILFPSEVLMVQVRTHNRGRAVWLAHGKGNRGAVYLQSRWFSSDREIPNMSGREDLQHDVFPGRSYEFTARHTTPRGPGEYILELGLVSDQVTLLSEQGVEPLKVAVHVLSPPGIDFTSAMAGRLKAIDDPPLVAITTGRERERKGGGFSR
jgi:hypothetical protein